MVKMDMDRRKKVISSDKIEKLARSMASGYVNVENDSKQNSLKKFEGIDCKSKRELTK
jgi:hypothetical protein